MFFDRPYPFEGGSRYNERIMPSPSIINDKICECMQRVDAILEHFDLTTKRLLYCVIPIVAILLWLVLFIPYICSTCWKKDKKQSENLQQDSNDLEKVIIHQDEPEDLSVMINPEMKLLATI
ncbi:unnamed protein product [Rotaria magnacalcarata]|uniref:Uncharacterized protein n=3 Tax=Rotaria magnacalcarata TaxID=392030 RepID=A0A815EWI1_9BILA|nr:unnamed protein product [Rotaria magnacalcarata]CAF1514909.1 unnamed protein product [Rotaria magnacalcarata]CAF5096711.1 unnamed protein product [Rotaria magnacalcarata]CAF5194392.1 unnamed protein product [Rotaria magnacalcarata]CAF5208337.1 unnamed protein product [Rotaria magnacalcarata]